MKVRNLVWGLLLIGVGILLATDLLPGADGFARGPRIGLVMALVTLGALVAGVPLTTWFLRKTTRPEDYQGTCPVGRVCASCGAFNYNPRTVCRSCAADLSVVELAKREPL